MASNSALKRLANLGSTNGDWVIASLERVQAYEGPGRSDPGWFHPSDLGNVCDAYLAFKYLGAPELQKISAQLQRIFDNGNARDRQLKRDSAKSGISLITKESDRKIEIKLLHIRGELDDWIQNPISKERYVVDFKTMRSDLFKGLSAAVESHRAQLHPYMFGKETYKGYILYENKDTQEFKIFDVPFNWDFWHDGIEGRIERVLSLLEKGHVNRNPVSCSSCPFFANGVCTSNRIEELKEKSGLWKVA